MMRILIVRDHRVARSAVRSILERVTGWKVVAEVDNGKDAVAKAVETRPDVAIIDDSSGEVNSIETIYRIHVWIPKTEILVLTGHHSDDLVGQLREAGARGHMVKSDAKQYLIAAVETMADRKPFFAGRIAMSPDGVLFVAGGWTRWTTESKEESIYVFETRTGKMTARIAGLPTTTNSLAFSSDGRYLAAGLGGISGLRVYDRDRQWTEVFDDSDYDDDIYGVSFAADGRLATASLDGMVRLYDRDFKLIVPARKTPGSGRPFRIAFSPRWHHASRRLPTCGDRGPSRWTFVGAAAKTER